MKEVLLMVSVDRAKRIIRSYGGRIQAWPASERQAVVRLLLDSKTLTDIQQQALLIDDLIGGAEYKAEDELDQQCAERILANLPEQQRKIHPIAMLFLPYKHIFRETMSTAAPVILVAAVVMSVLSLSNSLSFNENTDNSQYLTLSEYMAVYVEDNNINEDENTLVNDDQLEILAFIEPQIISDNDDSIF